MENNFVKLAAIDCADKIEKKGNLSYLSWAWAVDQLMRQDPLASWVYGEPKAFGDTMMVVCTVSAFGKAMTSHLPVMDNRNKAIANPDAFQVNTAMQRCLVKAIALHGLGLYIYAGEDLPMVEEKTITQDQVTAICYLLDETKTNKAAFEGWLKYKVEDLPEAQYARVIAALNKKKESK